MNEFIWIGKVKEKKKIVDTHPRESLKRVEGLKIVDVLRRALGDRFLKFDMKDFDSNKIVLGITLNRETLFYTRILGPLNEQEDKCRAFHALWGDRSALMRQDNGSFRVQIDFARTSHPDQTPALWIFAYQCEPLLRDATLHWLLSQ